MAWAFMAQHARSPGICNAAVSCRWSAVSCSGTGTRVFARARLTLASTIIEVVVLRTYSSISSSLGMKHVNHPQHDLIIQYTFHCSAQRGLDGGPAIRQAPDDARSGHGETTTAAFHVRLHVLGHEVG